MWHSRYAICQLYSIAHVIMRHSIRLSPRCVRNVQCGQWGKERTKERHNSTSQLISQLLHYCCCQTKHNSSLALSLSYTHTHTHTSLQMCLCVLVCLCGNNCVGCLLPVFVIYLWCNFIPKHKGGHSWLGLMWIWAIGWWEHYLMQLQVDETYGLNPTNISLSVPQNALLGIFHWNELSVSEGGCRCHRQDLLLEQEPELRKTCCSSSFWSSQVSWPLCEMWLMVLDFRF